MESIVEMKNLNRITKTRMSSLGNDLRDLCMSCSTVKKKDEVF